MSSTTIKLEDDLVHKVIDIKSDKQSISAFVRSLIEKEYLERQLRQSALAYEQFLKNDPGEREAMDTWESALLTDETEPKTP